MTQLPKSSHVSEEQISTSIRNAAMKMENEENQIYLMKCGDIRNTTRNTTRISRIIFRNLFRN